MKKLIPLLIFLLLSTTSARYISLATTVTTESLVLSNETCVNIKLLNSGDEPAYDVQLSLLLPKGFKSNSLFPGRLDPGHTYTGNFSLAIDSSITPGKYPVVILTEYKDANGYQFSSVSPSSLFIKRKTISRISGIISEVSLGNKEIKKLTLRLRNLDDKEHKLRIKLFLPRELKIEPDKIEVLLTPNKEEKLEFDISSFGALIGSTYVVFASVEYEDSNLHYSSLLRGTVKIVEKQDMFNFSGWLPIAILCGLILIFIYYQFKR